MPSQRLPIPSSWAAYDRGGRQDSVGSARSVAFDEESQRPRPSGDDTLHPGSAQTHDGRQHLRHRRSSLAQRVNTIRTAGGVNSIDNFARSWQRAAGFYEIRPVRQSFRYAESQEDEDQDEDEDGEGGEPQYQRGDVLTPKAQKSLLREQLEHHRGDNIQEEALEDDDQLTATPQSRKHEEDAPAAREETPLLRERVSKIRGDSIMSIEPQLASPFGGSYGSTWGSLASRANEPSMRHAGRLFRQQQVKGTSEPEQEREPLLVKQVQEDDGKVVNVVVGQSTLPQTIFNSVNVLIGVGILALPLAMKYAGWIPGLLFLGFAAWSTSYTAKLLAKCADVDSSLITFADLAYVSFGPSARIITSVLFSLELLGACVALVVLFADSLNALVPGYGLTEWKLICGLLLLPLNFIPLRFLSFTSILGILSCFGIVTSVIICGLLKPSAPGSLLHPTPTPLFPENWATLPISLGLLMSPWGGHSVFPNIYRDMRHPYKYRRALNTTYTFTLTLDYTMAIAGLLMFGPAVRDEITANVVLTPGYPALLKALITTCVAVIPLTKVPLNARPILSTLELSLGLDARALPPTTTLTGLSGLTRGVLKTTLRVLVTASFVGLAIALPGFDTIMSLMGSVACFTICIILPCGFHLKLFGHELGRAEKVRDWTLIGVSGVMAVVSTAFNFLPEGVLGL